MITREMILQVLELCEGCCLDAEADRVTVAAKLEGAFAHLHAELAMLEELADIVPALRAKLDRAVEALDHVGSCERGCDLCDRGHELLLRDIGALPGGDS